PPSCVSALPVVPTTPSESSGLKQPVRQAAQSSMPARELAKRTIGARVTGLPSTVAPTTMYLINPMPAEKRQEFAEVGAQMHLGLRVRRPRVPRPPAIGRER